MAYEQVLSIDSDIFDEMREDADRVIQKLIKNMVEKNGYEGSVTIKLDFGLSKEGIRNFNNKIAGDIREVLLPTIEHKVSSTFKISEERKAKREFQDEELVWDDSLKMYVIKPIADTTQRSIFDADYKEVVVPNESKEVSALPGPTNLIEEKEVEDITEDIVAEVVEEEDARVIPFSDDYDYEEIE